MKFQLHHEFARECGRRNSTHIRRWPRFGGGHGQGNEYTVLHNESLNLDHEWIWPWVVVLWGNEQTVPPILFGHDWRTNDRESNWLLLSFYSFLRWTSQGKKKKWTKEKKKKENLSFVIDNQTNSRNESKNFLRIFLIRRPKKETFSDPFYSLLFSVIFYDMQVLRWKKRYSSISFAACNQGRDRKVR